MLTNSRTAKIKLVAQNQIKNLTLVLEDIHDPHNAGAILRTCDAFGIREVHLVFNQEKPWNLSLARPTAQSALNWLTIHTYTTPKDCHFYLKDHHCEIISTTLSQPSQDISQINLKPQNQYALVVGNEHRGISHYFQKNSQFLVHIPMRGMVQSLNVSVATAICLYQLIQVFK